MNHPLGLRILVAGKLKDSYGNNGYGIEFYTLLSTVDEYLEDVGDFANHLNKSRIAMDRRWTLKNPRYVGVVDVFWVGESSPKTGVPLGTYTHIVKDERTALALARKICPTFPIWVISSYVVIEACYYLPPCETCLTPELRIANSLHGKFNLEKGYPSSTRIQRHLISKPFLRMVALPRIYSENSGPVLLDWTLIPTEIPLAPLSKRVVLVEPYYFPPSKKLNKMVMSEEQIEESITAVAERWKCENE